MCESRPLLRAYVDTNIFDYVALRHPTLGRACKKITDDIRDGVLEAYCSYLVPIEILGSLAKVDRRIADGAILAFFSFPVRLIPVDNRLLRKASEIMLKTGLTYDSIHAAAAKRAEVNAVITEDTRHWSKIEGVEIIRPLDYGRVRK